MLSIVATDQHQATAGVERQAFDHREPARPYAAADAEAQPSRSESAEHPRRKRDEPEDEEKREGEFERG